MGDPSGASDRNVSAGWIDGGGGDNIGIEVTGFGGVLSGQNLIDLAQPHPGDGIEQTRINFETLGVNQLRIRRCSYARAYRGDLSVTNHHRAVFNHRPGQRVNLCVADREYLGARRRSLRRSLRGEIRRREKRGGDHQQQSGDGRQRGKKNPALPEGIACPPAGAAIGPIRDGTRGAVHRAPPALAAPSCGGWVVVPVFFLPGLFFLPASLSGPLAEFSAAFFSSSAAFFSLSRSACFSFSSTARCARSWLRSKYTCPSIKTFCATA